MTTPLTADKPERGPIELTPAGTHVATLFKIIYLGTVTEEWEGQKKNMKKVRLYWELPNKKKVFVQNGEERELPFAISRELTLSMGEKSNLRPLIVGMTGVQFASEEEAHNFNVFSLLGHACLINVIHKIGKQSQKMKAEVASCTPLLDGMAKPEPVNEQVVLDVREMTSEEIEALPEFIRDRMKTSAEYHQRFLQPKQPDYPAGPEEQPPF